MLLSCANEWDPTPDDPMNESFPHVLSSTALFSSCTLMPMTSLMGLIYLMSGLPLFLLLFIFYNTFVFSKEFCLLMMYPTLQFCHFCLEQYFRPSCSFFWWSRISLEISSNTIFQMNKIFCHHPSSLSNFLIHTEKLEVQGCG